MTYYAFLDLRTNQLVVSPANGCPILFVLKPSGLAYDSNVYKLVVVELKVKD